MASVNEIRVWAGKKGYQVSTRGPLSAEVKQAHAEWRAKNDARNAARKAAAKAR